jgi:hypothetical protein
MTIDSPALPLHCPYCGEPLIFLRTEIAGEFPEHRYVCRSHREFGVSRDSFRSIPPQPDYKSGPAVRLRPDRRKLPRVD